MPDLRLGSLCTGYGGLDRAVMAVTGASLAWVADNDPDVSVLLGSHHPGVPNLGDISRVRWEAVSPVAILAAGFPCENISCAGKRDGLQPGNHSGVWYHVATAISVLRPSLVVIENVRRITSAKAYSQVECDGECVGDRPDIPLSALGAVLGDLSSLGYDAEWRSILASDVGAPHRRDRVFILAWPAADPRPC